MSVIGLREQLQLQEQMFGIFATLENAHPERVDLQIQEALCLLAELLEVDCVWLAEFVEERFQITHSSKAGFIHDDAEASRFIVAFSIAGSMQGQIGFGCLNGDARRLAPYEHQLKRAGEFFAHAIYRKRLQEKIQNQIKFEEFISDLSGRFVSLHDVDVDEEINEGLRRLLQFFDVDRCSLIRLSSDHQSADVTHTSVRNEAYSIATKVDFQTFFPWMSSRLLERETVSLHVSDLPREAAIDRRSAEQMGIRSVLIVPLRVDGLIRHVISVISIRHAKSWEETMIARIRLVGEIFTSAIARKRARNDLMDSLRQIQSLKNRLEAETEYLRSEIKVAFHHHEIVGESDAIRKVLAQVEQVAATDSSVLIQGETGTGKELIARAIHNLSARKSRAMVKINCASLPSSLIESELFGREKGAFTGALTKQIGRFEIADKSTIFLDEIGELSLELQTKLLRVLQEGEFERLGSPRTIKVDVRFIAATNRNLADAIRAGTFREDLYYRLNVFPITVPPLRERAQDIPLLVTTFLQEFREKIGKNIDSVHPQSMRELVRYAWPGNIRELRNVMEHALIISNEGMLRVPLPKSNIRKQVHHPTFQEFETNYIRTVLQSTNWMIKGPRGAAKILGLKPSTLYYKMQRLGIVKS